MKINTRICDICGKNSVYRLRRDYYQITKRTWGVDLFSKKLDLCQDCYCGMEKFILDRFDKENENG